MVTVWGAVLPVIDLNLDSSEVYYWVRTRTEKRNPPLHIKGWFPLRRWTDYKNGRHDVESTQNDWIWKIKGRLQLQTESKQASSYLNRRLPGLDKGLIVLFRLLS
jgi:hypothetical protein